MRTPLVSICIATYKRPDGLGRLLESISHIEGFRDEDVEIHIVDNDEGESGREIFDTHASMCRFRMQYQVEVKQNIARARNRGIAAASGMYCAFVDDDETVSPSWLKAHVNMLETTQLNGTFGPVVPCYEVEPPEWIVQGGYYARNTLLPPGRIHFITGNACLRRDSLLESPLFDESMGLSGGSDTALFEWMSRNGFSFGVCPDAIVTEFIPKERTTFSYRLRRAFRGGQTYVRIVSRTNRLRALLYVILGAGQLALLPCMSLFIFPFNRARAIQMLLKAIRAAGKLSLLTPFRIEEYRR